MTDHLASLIRAQIHSDIERAEMAVFSGGTVTSTVSNASDGAMTIEKMRQAIREFNPPPPPRLTITYSTHALKDTEERLFPDSKNRSKRVRKKLIKRHGGEFRRVPTIWRIEDKIVAHPSFRSQLEAHTKETTDVQMHACYENAMVRSPWL